jgi:hypothetical protein
MVHTYKFGVLYCQESQTKKEKMFSNENDSTDFDDFMSMLGESVVLKGFPSYRGGLDNQHDSTGTHSIYSKYRDYEIMFHVSTMLPYSFDNPQQLERKRHLGNDIVVVVFKEGNTPYVPACISSDFNHVVAVVSAVRQDGKLFYRLSVASKDGVPAFTPHLPDPALFEAGPKFRDIILCKRTPIFPTLVKATRFSLQLHSYQRRESFPSSPKLFGKDWPNAICPFEGSRRKVFEIVIMYTALIRQTEFPAESNQARSHRLRSFFAY